MNTSPPLVTIGCEIGQLFAQTLSEISAKVHWIHTEIRKLLNNNDK